MSGYNFTDRVRTVLQMAREEAARLHHEYVGTEHILLGLAREGEGVAAAVLTNLGADLDDIRRTIEKAVKEGEPSTAAGPDLPYTSKAKRVLEFAMKEARDMNHSFVGTEHLLLGLMGEGQGIGAQVLAEFGVSLKQARAETLRLLSGGKGAQPLPRRSHSRSTGFAIRGSSLRLVGGVVFIMSGLEALWYAPTWFGKAAGLLGAVGGLLLLALWMSDFRA
jgi:ATP-dependent Clp protease ATP-binding subunit ClpA